jgi:hypothetical protein
MTLSCSSSGIGCRCDASAVGTRRAVGTSGQRATADTCRPATSRRVTRTDSDNGTGSSRRWAGAPRRNECGRHDDHRLPRVGLEPVDLGQELVEAELSRFEITPAVTDRIEDAAVWLARDSGLAPWGRIGLMGISFSGGLAIVAAGRAPLRNRLLYVLSFGGHDDLSRVLEYFCTGNKSETASNAGCSASTASRCGFSSCWEKVRMLRRRVFCQQVTQCGAPPCNRPSFVGISAPRTSYPCFGSSSSAFGGIVGLT